MATDTNVMILVAILSLVLGGITCYTGIGLLRPFAEEKVSVSDRLKLIYWLIFFAVAVLFKGLIEPPIYVAWGIIAFCLPWIVLGIQLLWRGERFLGPRIDANTSKETNGVEDDKGVKTDSKDDRAGSSEGITKRPPKSSQVEPQVAETVHRRLRRVGALLIVLCSIIIAIFFTLPKRPEETSLKFRSPTTGDSVPVRIGGFGGTVEVNGTSQGLYGKGYVLLLLVDAPYPGPEHVVQWGPNGIKKFLPNGDWSGLAQVGNRVYSPTENQKFALHVYALSKVDYDRHIDEAKNYKGLGGYSLREPPKVREEFWDSAKDLTIQITK